ncbi:hypothetical protein AK830_g9463 [Neonectria ditissima]|uniref:RING-type E3 ubiquitin transferase n=1 Tax=Neonectria ditissima TaxID=78410 RepID=A0A0P7ARW5_9HYPO|nr:hypothetical protein AK830_g9463 [Neonectria ditissima]
MSSHDAERGQHGHLDATAGRDVVFCHACSNEWYRDSHGLECPRCGGEITEIIEPDNDPRDLDQDHHSSASTSPEIAPLRFTEDNSDPEEADITEQLGPNGFTYRRSVRNDPEHHHHHNPNVDPVLARFLDMIQGLGGPGHPRSNIFPPGSINQEPLAQPRIQRTTFTSGSFGGGTTSVTIVSGPLAGGQPGVPIDPFQSYAPSIPSQPQRPGGLRVTSISMTMGANHPCRIFSNIVRDVGPPGDGNQAGPEGTGGGPPRLPFIRSLQDILNLINPGNAVAGDAVYSQEALDRIITGLMEANPQSNAAPPATESALQNLTRKLVNKEMLGSDGKTECTICIDEMKEGETVIFLPCKHWFHEDCVVLWLKEHNTCPICRTPIEKLPPPPLHPADLAFPSSRILRTPQEESNNHSEWYPGPSPHDRSHDASPESFGSQVRGPRPPSQSQSRLNEAMRSMTSLQRERERNRDHPQDQGTTSGFSYDTSRLQRRSSHSPTSPRAAGPEEQGARMRQRSPSESSRRSTSDRLQRRPSGHGPINWLRERLNGGGSGSGSSREGRRQ